MTSISNKEDKHNKEDKPSTVTATTAKATTSTTTTTATATVEKKVDVTPDGLDCIFLANDTLRSNPSIEEMIALVPNRNVMIYDSELHVFTHEGCLLAMPMLISDFPTILKTLSVIPYQTIRLPGIKVWGEKNNSEIHFSATMLYQTHMPFSFTPTKMFMDKEIEDVD